VLEAFTKLTAADRIADSRHVYAYCQDYHEAVRGEDWLDAQMGIPQSPEQIWKHVTPGQVFVERSFSSDQHYLVMEAECAWEEEHGLMMVWRSGTTLCKTGGYDGHITNVDAFADEAMKDVVYAANDQKFTTRLD
jgi:hypothetical protein